MFSYLVKIHTYVTDISGPREKTIKLVSTLLAVDLHDAQTLRNALEKTERPANVAGRDIYICLRVTSPYGAITIPVGDLGPLFDVLRKLDDAGELDNDPLIRQAMKAALDNKSVMDRVPMLPRKPKLPFNPNSTTKL